VYDLTTISRFQQMTPDVSRSTAQPASSFDCCGASVNGNTKVRQTGLVDTLFPDWPQKQTYQVFDTNR